MAEFKHKNMYEHVSWEQQFPKVLQENSHVPLGYLALLLNHSLWVDNNVPILVCN